MNYPTISVVIPTFNSAKTLTACLESVRTQMYPKKKIEIILADGGSRDTTYAVAKRYGAKVISVNKAKQGAEYNRGRGARIAAHDILLFIDHDNVLPHNKWMQAMVAPLVKDKTLVGVETLRYTYDVTDSFIGRYFSLFGANDIFAFYIGKADRLSYIYDHLGLYGVFKNAKVKDLGRYYRVDFDPNRIPTLGSNGFMIRKSVLFRHADVRPDHFFHIDTNVDLIRKGIVRYAFIKDSLHHKTDERGLWDYLRRRSLFMETYHFSKSAKRRYSLYEAGDFWPTVQFVLYSVTFIVPLRDAIRGYVRIRDWAWFLNPIMCFCLVILYGFAIIRRYSSFYANKILEK